MDADIDLFFYFDKTGTDFHGREVSMGSLEGMSGSSIWEFVSPEGSGVWVPEQSLRVVGVQTSFRPGEYARGKDWKYVRSIINRL